MGESFRSGWLADLSPPANDAVRVHFEMPPKTNKITRSTTMALPMAHLSSDAFNSGDKASVGRGCRMR